MDKNKVIVALKTSKKIKGNTDIDYVLKLDLNIYETKLGTIPSITEETILDKFNELNGTNLILNKDVDIDLDNKLLTHIKDGYYKNEIKLTWNTNGKNDLKIYNGNLGVIYKHTSIDSQDILDKFNLINDTCLDLNNDVEILNPEEFEKYQSFSL